MRANKTDPHDASGLAQLARTGFYKERPLHAPRCNFQQIASSTSRTIKSPFARRTIGTVIGGRSSVAADEFIRCFLLRFLPEGFHRIRYYGFLGNRYRARKLACCRELIARPFPSRRTSDPQRTIATATRTSGPHRAFPQAMPCLSSRAMIIIEILVGPPPYRDMSRKNRSTFAVTASHEPFGRADRRTPVWLTAHVVESR
ncbi:hypothetical protein AB7M37_005876 [Sinorhizobium fredii]